MSVKSQIPTPNQITKIDKESEIKKGVDENNRDARWRKIIIKIKEVEESSPSSSMPMYILDSDR